MALPVVHAKTVASDRHAAGSSARLRMDHGATSGARITIAVPPDTAVAAAVAQLCSELRAIAARADRPQATRAAALLGHLTATAAPTPQCFERIHLGICAARRAARRSATAPEWLAAYHRSRDAYIALLWAWRAEVLERSATVRPDESSGARPVPSVGGCRR